MLFNLCKYSLIVKKSNKIFPLAFGLLQKLSNHQRFMILILFLHYDTVHKLKWIWPKYNC